MQPPKCSVENNIFGLEKREVFTTRNAADCLSEHSATCPEQSTVANWPSARFHTKLRGFVLARKLNIYLQFKLAKKAIARASLSFSHWLRFVRFILFSKHYLSPIRGLSILLFSGREVKAILALFFRTFIKFYVSVPDFLQSYGSNFFYLILFIIMLKLQTFYF